MVVQETLKEVREYQKNVVHIERKVFGPLYKQDAKFIENAILALDDEQLSAVAVELEQQK